MWSASTTRGSEARFLARNSQRKPTLFGTSPALPSPGEGLPYDGMIRIQDARDTVGKYRVCAVIEAVPAQLVEEASGGRLSARITFASSNRAPYLYIFLFLPFFLSVPSDTSARGPGLGLLGLGI